jgi:hypothetical protein
VTIYGTYLRLDVTVRDNWRAVVRAAGKRLTPAVRANPAHRAARHRFYRQMLTYHQQAQNLVARRRL